MTVIFRNDVLFFQRLMSSAGLYTGELDGSAGELTRSTFDMFEQMTEAIARTYGTFDSRTEANIATLVPKAQRAARIFMSKAKGFKYEVKILSGTRTYAQQTVIFNQGRTTPGNIVTNARAGQSNHNFGIAWDVGIFDKGVYFTGRNAKEEQAYIALRDFTKPFTPSIAWGGDWKSSKDRPHYEMRTNKTTAQVRALLEKGKPYV